MSDLTTKVVSDFHNWLRRQSAERYKNPPKPEAAPVPEAPPSQDGGKVVPLRR